MEYIVEWAIDIDGDSPEAAARKALRIQRDPNSIATVFTVCEKRADGTLGAEVSVDLGPNSLSNS
jgi:hypothetical protein